MPRVLHVALAATFAAVANQAHAAWYQASSKHFVIYSDSNPKQLESFASELERFDKAVRTVMHYDDPPLGAENRLTVFVLPGVDSVRKMGGKAVGNALGFYTPRAEGCIAFVPKAIGYEETGGLDTNAVFFHEYTHHLQFANLTAPMPEWLVEGFAEFMQTAKFQKDGSILLGSAPEERAWGLLSADSIPLESMFSEGYQQLNDAQRDQFYGQGWLLTHYLFMTPARSPQLVRYLDLLNSGASRVDAARQAFGDVKQLQRELTIYKHQPSLFAMPISSARTQPGPIVVTPLSPGAAAVIQLRGDLKLNGSDKSTAQRLEQQIKAVEAQYPGDELVETTLAAADLDVGDPANAQAAAERALKVNPKNVEALVYEGRAKEELAHAGAASQRQEGFEEARNLFIAANKIETEDPEPLYQYYKSYLLEGVRPTDNAIAAMHYASDLVPQDFGLRMNSAIAYLNEDKPKDARATLTVVAYSPHSGSAGETARRLIAAIDAGKGRNALLELKTPTSKSSGQR